jgi:LysM repeat protein
MGGTFMRNTAIITGLFILLLLGLGASPAGADANKDIQRGIDLFHQGKITEAIDSLQGLLDSNKLDKFEAERVQAKLQKYREYARLQDEYLRLAKAKDEIKPKQSTVPQYGMSDTYTVRPGDTLWLIASYGFIYNDITKGSLIYEANRDQISDPNMIRPGQVLRITH